MADPKGFLKHGREVADRRPVEERVHDWGEVYPGSAGRALLPIIGTQAAVIRDKGLPFLAQRVLDDGVTAADNLQARSFAILWQQMGPLPAPFGGPLCQRSRDVQPGERVRRRRDLRLARQRRLDQILQMGRFGH